MVNGELCIGIYALTDVKQSDEVGLYTLNAVSTIACQHHSLPAP
jgi:hypothetical protein